MDRRLLYVCLLLILCLSSAVLAGKKKKKNKIKICSPKKFKAIVRVGVHDPLRQVQQFSRAFNDRVKFPKISLTASQALWMVELKALPVRNLTAVATPVKPTTAPIKARIARGAGKRLKLKATPFCPNIPGPMRVRKEYRQLTFSERQSFHNALNSLKGFLIGGQPAYDIFPKWHRGSVSPSAHGGAAFLPWHREFLLRFENALFERGFTGPGLPYWDSTLDQGLPDPAASVLWSPSYMGNNNGYVTTGPAANWATIPECNGPLRRNMWPGSGASSLYNDADLAHIFSKNCYQDIIGGRDWMFEGVHGSVHGFVGGHMGGAACSPSDPVFFLHHAFVDCIWEEFRKEHQQTNLETEYPQTNFGGSNHAWNIPMEPFEGMINVHGLSNHYTNYYYKCNPRPLSCEKNSDCKSSALWCDVSKCRCRARIRPGGNCGNLPNSACGGCPIFRIPQCKSGICICKSFDIKRFQVVDAKLVPIAAKATLSSG